MAETEQSGSDPRAGETVGRCRQIASFECRCSRPEGHEGQHYYREAARLAPPSPPKSKSELKRRLAQGDPSVAPPEPGPQSVGGGPLPGPANPGSLLTAAELRERSGTVPGAGAIPQALEIAQRIDDALLGATPPQSAAESELTHLLEGAADTLRLLATRDGLVKELHDALSVAQKYMPSLDGKRHDHDLLERAALSAGPPPEVHECATWRMEGIGCAECNPIARALRAEAQGPPPDAPDGAIIDNAIATGIRMGRSAAADVIAAVQDELEAAADELRQTADPARHAGVRRRAGSDSTVSRCGGVACVSPAPPEDTMSDDRLERWRSSMTDADVVERASAELSRLCKGGGWRMTIPVDFDRDSDLILSEAIRRLRGRAVAPPGGDAVLVSTEFLEAARDYGKRLTEFAESALGVGASLSRETPDP